MIGVLVRGSGSDVSLSATPESPWPMYGLKVRRFPIAAVMIDGWCRE